MLINIESGQSVFLGYLKQLQDFYASKMVLENLSSGQKRAGVKLKKSCHIVLGTVYSHEESVLPLASGKWKIQKQKGGSDFTVKALDGKTEKRKVVISLENKRKDEIFFSYYEDGDEVEICILGDKVLDTKENIENLDLLKTNLQLLSQNLNALVTN
jgi:hypothetical protein